MEQCDTFSQGRNNLATEQFVRLEQRLGCRPSPKRVAHAMRLEFQDHVAFLKHKGKSDEQLVDWFSGILGGIPESERMVIALFYKEKLNLEEIARVLDRSESEIYQMYTNAILKLCAEVPSV